MRLPQGIYSILIVVKKFIAVLSPFLCVSLNMCIYNDDIYIDTRSVSALGVPLHSHFFGQPISFPCSSRYTVFEASEDQGEPSRKSYLPGFFFSNKRIVCQLHKGLTAWTSSGIQVCREIELSFSSSLQEFLYFQLPLSNTDFTFTSKIGFFC